MKLPKRGKFSLRITSSKTKKSSKNKIDKGKDGLLEGSYKENKENLVSFFPRAVFKCYSTVLITFTVIKACLRASLLWTD